MTPGREMATRQLMDVIENLRQAVLPRGKAARSDGQLLTAFIERHDESAFADLVRRHGPMVWGVCRRILLGHHDAEDAFQATFVVLVRRARCVTPRDLVGNWLYGVAYQTALKARATRAARRSREPTMAAIPEPAAPEPRPCSDLQAVLDLELSRLPERYRVPIVLCDLEGKSRRQAAHEVGCPEGTLAARVARGRKMLARRLARRGLGMSVGALAAVLGHSATAATVPAALCSDVIRAVRGWTAGQAATGTASARVAALAEGVIRAMTLKRMAISAAVLFVVLAFGAGSAGLIGRAPATEGSVSPGKVVNAGGEKDPPKAEAKKLTLTVHVVLESVDTKSGTITGTVATSTTLYELLIKDAIEQHKDPTSAKVLLDWIHHKEHARLVNIPVAAEAKITANGKAIKLADLKDLKVATLELSAHPAGLVIVGIKGGPPAKEKKP